MVKHISKIIKETELYRELQQRKLNSPLESLEEFLPGVSKAQIIEKALFQPVSGVVSETEHEKSVKKPR